MHVLLAAMPFAGHVYPMLGLAEALLRRGHTVTVYTGTKYREPVIATGATWLGFQATTDFDDTDPSAAFPDMRRGDGPLAMLSSFEHIFFGTGPAQACDILDLHAKEPIDVVVGEGTCVGPSLVHDLAGIPDATMTQSPLGLGMPAAIDVAARLTVNRAFRQLHNRARSQVGLPPTGRPGLEGVWSRELVLAQGVEALERPGKPVDPRIHFIGDAAEGTRTDQGRAGSGEEPADDWWARIPTGQPLIHVSQGTLGADAFPLTGRVAEATRGLNCHCVMTGTVPPVEGADHVTTREWVPQDRVFERAALFVTNGGYGAVLAALSHGVPVLVVPGAQDKPIVARAVAGSGAGWRLSPRRATVQRLHHTIGTMLHDPTESARLRDRAGKMAREFAAAGGADRAAQLVEARASGVR